MHRQDVAASTAADEDLAAAVTRPLEERGVRATPGGKDRGHAAGRAGTDDDDAPSGGRGGERRRHGASYPGDDFFYMRIVGGKFAGRDLVSPNDFRVRPTSELVRAAMLDQLADVVKGARILDLFAGTGARHAVERETIAARPPPAGFTL